MERAELERGTPQENRASRPSARLLNPGTPRGEHLEKKLSSAGLELEFDLVPEGFGLFAVVAKSEDRNSSEAPSVD